MAFKIHDIGSIVSIFLTYHVIKKVMDILTHNKYTHVYLKKKNIYTR